MSDEQEVQVEETSGSKIDNLDDALKVIADLRKENASKRVKTKEVEDKAALWERHLEEQKTELEKLTESKVSLEQENASLRQQNLLDKIVREEGVDPEDIEFLVGNTEEELRAKAKKLAEKSKKLKEKGQPANFFGGIQGVPAGTKTPEDNLETYFAEMWRTSNKARYGG